MIKHTPGPWRADPDDKLNPMRAYGIVRPLGAQFDEEAGTVGATEVIAEVCSSEGDYALHDAQLIAAAPDMLAAMREAEAYLLEFIDDSDGGMRALSSNTLRILQAAINKAAGK